MKANSQKQRCLALRYNKKMPLIQSELEPIGSYKSPKKCGRENLIDKEMEGYNKFVSGFFSISLKVFPLFKVEQFYRKYKVDLQKVVI